MNSTAHDDKTSSLNEQNKDGSLPVLQINPITLLNSIPTCKQVDDTQENLLELAAMNKSQTPSSDITMSLQEKFEQIHLQNPSTITHMDEHAIAAWVQSTTSESVTSPIERSPSLPATIIEQIITSSRRTSTVSTLCDHQPQQQPLSTNSDTISSTVSQNLSSSNDFPRSFSYPMADHDQHGNDRVQFVLDNYDDEFSSQFQPVPESEDSELDKKASPLEEPVKFSMGSSTSEVNKKTANVTFDASVSFEARSKQIENRPRFNSWNSNKKKISSCHRSQSHKLSSQSALSNSQDTQKQYITRSSLPMGKSLNFNNKTNQPSVLSDHCFSATSATNSPSASCLRGLTNHAPLDPQFLSLPSCTSIFSSGLHTSNISDLSGKSGIESSNLKTSASEIPRTASIIEEELVDERTLFALPQKRDSSISADSSRTASTEDLPTSSSEDEVNNFHKKLNALNKAGKSPQTPTNQRLDVLRQLKWLLEKKAIINPRYNPGSRKMTPTAAMRSSFRLTNTLPTIQQVEPILSNIDEAPVQLFSSSNDNLNQAHSLPIGSDNNPSVTSTQVTAPVIDPLSQSYHSVRSIHSDSSLTGALINSKASTRSPGTGAISLTSSLNLQRNTINNSTQSQRRRPNHPRRNLSGLAAVQRDRKNSFTKSNTVKIDEHQHGSQLLQQPTAPLVRDTNAILNEHLTMIKNLLLNSSFNGSMQFASQNFSIRDFLYTGLNELSSKNPMKQRCSRTEIKNFIDSITDYQMNRSHHYHFLLRSIRDLSKSNNDPVRLSTCSSEADDDLSTVEDKSDDTRLGNFSVPSSPGAEVTSEQTNNIKAFKDHSLRFFRTLSSEYIHDCERTEKDLTQKLFDIADKQHILYCLKHVDSGHTKDLLALFHRRLDAICVWYNLYYELTISVKKLSGLLRCDDCDDWPKLHFRSLATERERKAKRAEESDETDESGSNDDDDDDADDPKATKDSEIESESRKSVAEKVEDADDTDILPTICWSDEPLDQFSTLKISDESSHLTDDRGSQKLDRTACYRNFVYYMDKRSYQVKYDGLARTLIERVAPVLFKTRLALLQAPNRADIKIEEILAGLTASDIQSSSENQIDSKLDQTTDDIDDKLVDTDNPVKDDSTSSINIGELTIEKWLHHVLKSCPTIKTICTHTDDMLKQNWLELHEQLGLPSLLPLYFFIINVLLDVMNECLSLYNKPYMNNDIVEIDPLCRQQLVREAKLVLRDALATRLYSVRMMEQFVSNRKMAYELTEFDEKTVNLYMHYKQFLSTVSINRSYDIHNDQSLVNEIDKEYYHYVDEETSELIKEYYFARDLTLTLGNRDLIHSLGFQFYDLLRDILSQLKEELYETTEVYYQVFATDTSNASNISDELYSAEVISESTHPPYFHSSVSAPTEIMSSEFLANDLGVSFTEQKKVEIINSTREFRRSFDTIKQRAIRICSLGKSLIDDFSIAAEFKCHNYHDLWHQLRLHSYAQVKLHLDTSNAHDFDSFYLFVPPWLTKNKNQVEKLLTLVCSQQTPADDATKSNKNLKPSFMIFIPKRASHLHNPHWTGDIVLIRASESTQLALNLTELRCLHLVVTRSDHWQEAVDIFQVHAGLNTNSVPMAKKVARDEDLRSTFNQLPDFIVKLSNQLIHLVCILNTIWDQASIKIFLTEIVKFDERELRTIESKLLDLVLYVYHSGFELFRLLYDLIPPISSNEDRIFRNFVGTMNEFFCEWCKCVTKKFKYTLTQQANTAKYKVLRPRWFVPGMVFLGFLAAPPHLQLLTEDEYKKLMTEMPAALKALKGNTIENREASFLKVRSNSASSLSSTTTRQRNRSTGHRRFDSGGGIQEFSSPIFINPAERIRKSIENREQELERNLRERKQIGKIYDSTATIANGSTLDPGTSLKTRNIDFPWRRGTRIGQGGAGVAFRAINCSNGSIVCMKEIQLSSIASRSLPNTYDEKLRRISAEIEMIMSINHPNIVRYFGIERYKRTIYICMEYCLSTVNEFLNDIRAFEKRAYSRRSSNGLWSDSSDQEDEVNTNNVRLGPALNVNELVRGFVKQLLQALLALHEKNIVHCDVKGDNIFIASQNGHYIVKLGDFNLSHRLELEARSPSDSDSRSTQFGTLYFKPPEPEYVYQSDIWALGCTVIEMLTGKLPWTNVTRPHEERIYIQNQLLAKKGPPIPDEIKNEHEAYDFIQLCLTPDFNERPLAKSLLDHPYPRVRTDS